MADTLANNPWPNAYPGLAIGPNEALYTGVYGRIIMTKDQR